MIRHFKNETTTTKTNSDHFVFSDSFKNLGTIKQTGINLAILPRAVNLKLFEFIQSLDLTIFPAIQTSFYAYECATVLSMLLKNITVDKQGLEILISDLTEVTQQFSAIVHSELVRFRLQVVDNDMCRYFHCDYNNLRLISTYSGDGTQWIANENLNRNKLGCQNNKEIVKDSSNIHQMKPFWVGIFKGELFLNNHGNGIIHRSPPISDRSKRRLLLRIDA